MELIKLMKSELVQFYLSVGTQTIILYRNVLKGCIEGAGIITY